MSIPKKELIDWLQSIPDEEIAIDEGGICVVGCDYDGQSSGACLEVGGDSSEEE